MRAENWPMVMTTEGSQVTLTRAVFSGMAETNVLKPGVIEKVLKPQFQCLKS